MDGLTEKWKRCVVMWGLGSEQQSSSVVMHDGLHQL